MSCSTAEQIYCKTESEVKNSAVNFTDVLESTELIIGTPTVTEVGTSDLVITNNVVNTAQLTILDETVLIGKAVQYTVSGGLASVGRYAMDISVTTDAGQTLRGEVILNVGSD